MTTHIDHTTAEHRFRAYLREHELPEPDEVAHWRDTIVFGWHESKAIVVLDLDEVDEAIAQDLPGIALGGDLEEDPDDLGDGLGFIATC